MSKRNFILLIIILILVVGGVFIFLHFRNPAPTDNGDNTGFFLQFNPFKSNPVTNPPVVTPPVDVSGYQPPDNAAVEASKLKKVSSMPIAGYGVFMKERLKDVPIVAPTTPPTDTPTPAVDKKGKKVVPTPPLTEFMPALRYVDRATGNVFQTFADKIEERKFSTTIIPKVYEAYFGSMGESVIMRYLKLDEKTIVTFLGNLPKEYIGADTTADNEIKGSFLPENVTDVSISPDAQKVFYLFNSGDSVIGTISNFSDNKKTQVFDSPFTEWLTQWPSAKIVTLTTKPAASVLGYMYTLNLDNKNFNKTLGGVNGLTTLTSPNGKLVLYGNNNLSLSIYHADTRASELIGVRTLPEKCAWNSGSSIVYCAVPKIINDGQYPDAWYQGDVSFNDQIWRIDASTGNTTMVVDPITPLGGEEVDGTKLAMDANENYLFFVNKKDSILWELALK